MKNISFISPFCDLLKTFTSTSILDRASKKGIVNYSYFQNKYMQCVNGFGSSFTINKISLKFVYTVGLGYIIDRKSSDDLILSYGECSLF